uniref:transposase n=1 Tax=Streptomyces lomondensis TaxID=68229 RepID=UPI0027E282B2|nr:transposase [Streptomyces lomondensis]
MTRSSRGIEPPSDPERFIGPDTAVTLLITIGDNPECLGNEASFAALCGVSPVERPSASRQYRRLNRGGDRQALHRIVQTRLRFDPRTQGLLRTPHQEGQDPTRNRPMPQTLRCPGGLPPVGGLAPSDFLAGLAPTSPLEIFLEEQGHAGRHRVFRDRCCLCVLLFRTEPAGRRAHPPESHSGIGRAAVVSWVRRP